MHEHPLFLMSMYLFVAVLLRWMRPNVLTAMFLLAVIIPSSMYLAARHGEDLLVDAYRLQDEFLTWQGTPPAWPPQVMRSYPDLQLVDASGRIVHLSSFKGRVILLQPVALTCPASVAFSGGLGRGPFRRTPPQRDLESIDTYVQQYSHVRLDDPRVVFIQLLLFNDQMQAPSAVDIADWKMHFGFDRPNSPLVFGATSRLATADSSAIIPGFQLIDQHFLLRMDSTGFSPRNDLYRDLLPLLGELVNR